MKREINSCLALDVRPARCMIVAAALVLLTSAPALPQELPPAAAALLSKVEEAENRAIAKARAKREAGAIEPQLGTATPVPTASPKPQPNDEIEKLVEEVKALQSKISFTKRESLYRKPPTQAKVLGSKTYYAYKEGDIFEIHAGIDRVTDIELEPGERLTASPVSGDTVRWKLGVTSSGEGKNEVTHLILKPLEEKIETNFIVATNRRVYHLRATASDWYMPSVAWHYPEKEAAAIEAEIQKRRDEERIPVSIDELNFSYQIEGSDSVPFKPIRIFDDGQKTYLQMPKSMRVGEAPALFALDERGDPTLVNYRLKGDYYIVDRLFERAELRVGAKRKVTVYSDSYKRSLFERIF